MNFKQFLIIRKEIDNHIQNRICDNSKKNYFSGIPDYLILDTIDVMFFLIKSGIANIKNKHCN